MEETLSDPHPGVSYWQSPAQVENERVAFFRDRRAAEGWVASVGLDPFGLSGRKRADKNTGFRPVTDQLQTSIQIRHRSDTDQIRACVFTSCTAAM